MVFNWTWATIILFIATVPEFGALIISMRGFWKHHYPYFAYMAITWAALSAGNLLIAIGYFTLDPIIYRVGIVGTAPVLFAIMFLVDWVSRESVDPKKLFMVTAISAVLVFSAFDPSGVQFQYSLLGEYGPAMTGIFASAGSLTFLVAGLMWLYYMAKIHVNAPNRIKFYSKINLLGAIFAGPCALLIFATGLIWIIPGTDYFFIGVGALCCAYSFAKEPKLGYILPFKVYRLQTVEITSGLLLHAYTWDERGLADSDLFSGALTGISALLQETLGKGHIHEIFFENGVLILEYATDSPLAFVLIASRSSPILKRALGIFAHAFGEKYQQQINARTFNNLSEFGTADELIDATFPFVVSYK